MINFKELPDGEKPRERLYNYGCENLSNEELLSIIIRTGTKDMSVKEVSFKLLEMVGDVRRLKDIGINSLMEIKGIGKTKAIEIKAVIEFGRRIYFEVDNLLGVKLNSVIKVYEYFNEYFKGKMQEYFYCVYLDTKGRVIDKKCLFIGTVNNSVVHPREVFKEAYLVSANGIICVHNHPSGDALPSKEDILVTRKLQEIGIIHGIKIIDHVIIGNNSYYSFLDNKKL